METKKNGRDRMDGMSFTCTKSSHGATGKAISSAASFAFILRIGGGINPMKMGSKSEVWSDGRSINQ